VKFIGQYIQQFIARFRADVYLENISTSSETGVLVVDSDGKITKNTSISGGVAGTVTVADESTDTTCFPAFVTAATGDLALKTGSNLSFNSSTGALTATSFVGPLTGQADTVATITGLAPDTATTAASQPNITSVGTLTSLDVSGNIVGGGKLEVNQAGTGTSNSPSDVAEFSGQSASGVVKALSLVNSVTAALGNGTQLAFHNASNYSPTGTITTTQAGDTTTDSKMEFQIYRGGLQTALTIDHDSNVTINQGTLTVGDTTINGPIITMTGSTNDTFFIRTTTDGETIFQTTDTAGAAAHMNFNPDGEFRVTSDDTIFKSNTSAHPTVKIQNQTADATSGELVFYNERHGGNGVGNDELGSIHFKGPNGDRSDAEFNFASIIGKNVFPNDTDEAGLIEIKVATSDGSTSALQSGVGIIGHPTANTTIVQLGYSTSCLAVVTGKLSAPRRQFFKTGTTDGTHDGDVVYFGSTTSMTTGALYHYSSSGTWQAATASDTAKSTGLLGVSLGSASDTDGVLLRGMVTLNHDPGGVGDTLYLNSNTSGVGTGGCNSTAPSGNGDIIRIVGYCLDASNGQIWFNPDNTFVEYTT
jgi:hypothetical protein